MGMLTERSRRIASMVFFVLMMLFPAIGYVVAFGCPTCFDGGRSGARFPAHFWVSSVIQKGPTYWMALSATSVCCPIAFLVLLDRYTQVKKAIQDMDPRLNTYNELARFWLHVAVPFIYLMAAVPISRIWAHFFLETIGFITWCCYYAVQIKWIEKELVNAGIVDGPLHQRKLTLVRWMQWSLTVCGITFALTGVTKTFRINSPSDLGMRVVSVVSEWIFLYTGTAVLGLCDFGNLNAKLEKKSHKKATSHVSDDVEV
ncbi:hypothetical protein BSKO_07041 [Bryopsis sp. KO-2023]|nr:hypothetical protein BSKO_07041 [Bryopsis sp. KO-2023]